MLRLRVIPILLLKDDRLVKTINFKKPNYIGDPCNTIRIFNELQVDELFLFDIFASTTERGPNYKIISNLVDECFMPLAYGGGINSLDQAKKIFDFGVEKISINSAISDNPKLINDLVKIYGSQAIICSIDYKKTKSGFYTVWTHRGTFDTKKCPIEWAKELEKRGAGEICFTSIDREGSWLGPDLEISDKASDLLSIPVVTHGGVGKIEHINILEKNTNISGIGVGSMFVYQNKGNGVLVNYPFEEFMKEMEVLKMKNIKMEEEDL